MKLGITPFLIFAALVAAGCADRGAQAEAAQTRETLGDKTILVEGTTTKFENAEVTLDLTGQITTSDDTVIGAMNSGRLVAMYVKEGDTVSAGQVIAKQDTSDLETRRRQAASQVQAAQSQLRQAQNSARLSPAQSASAVAAARAQLAQAESALLKLRNGAVAEERSQAEARMRAAKTSLDVAKAAMDRADRLLKEGAISVRDYDQARAAYANALAQYETAVEQRNLAFRSARDEDIRSAEAGVRQARENLQGALARQRLDVQFTEQVSAAQANLQNAREAVDLVNQSIENANVRAPFSGRIYGKPAQVGAMLMPGAPVARMVGREGLYFEGDVPESSIGQVEIGMPVTVHITAFKDRSDAGRVLAISPVSEDLGRLYKVRVGLENVDERVRVGMFAKGSLVAETLDNVIMLPSEAIVDPTGTPAVFVVTGDAKSKVRKQLVTVRRKIGDRSVVSGINAGEIVVVTGQLNLEPNSVIRLVKLDGNALTPPASEEKN